MASASSSSAPLVLPGQPLPSSGSTSRLGSGVYQRGPHMLSSLVGRVSSSGPVSVSGRPSRFVVPSPSSLVLGRITRVTPRQATCSILVVDGAPVASGDASAAGEANRAAGEDPSGADFTGVIRMQDVRMTEKDKVRLGDCFRPGDIVRASVVSRSWLRGERERQLRRREGGQRWWRWWRPVLRLGCHAPLRLAAVRVR